MDLGAVSKPDLSVCQNCSSHPFFSVWDRRSSPALPALWKRQSPQQDDDCFHGPHKVPLQSAADFARARLQRWVFQDRRSPNTCALWPRMSQRYAVSGGALGGTS